MGGFNESNFFPKIKMDGKSLPDGNVNSSDVQMVLLTLSERLDDLNVTNEHQQLIQELKKIIILADGNNPDYIELFFRAYDELTKAEKKPDLLNEVQKKFSAVIAAAKKTHSKNYR
ncbi:MAG: hypothetical protein Q8L78_08720 [Coxiellaceae bacterium]|nr:hypothetical protein [Coxiellaceae bacterium]